MRKTLASLLFTAAALLCASPGFAADKPFNLLWITADDMNGDSPGYMGNSLKLTPNLDAFAVTAMQFRSAHVTVPICQPGRSAFMTGRVPHRNGALGFQPITVGVPTMVNVLQKAGYYAGVIEKHVHMQPYSEFSWDMKLNGAGKNPPVMRQQVDQVLKAAKASGKPFFLNANITDPHRPWPGSEQKAGKRKAVAQAEAAAKADTAKKKAKNAKKKAAEGEDDEGEAAPRTVAEPGRIIKESEIKVPSWLPDLPDIRKETAQYYSSIVRFDESIKAIMDSLKASGEEENTIIVFLSDHGISMPFSKATVYFEGTWSPELVRWPGMGKPQVFEKEFVNSIDLMPSLLEIMGVKAPEGLDGRSWLPLTRGEKQDGRDYIITHVNTVSSSLAFPQRCIRTHNVALMFNGWVDGKEKFKVEAMGGLTFAAMEKARKDDAAIDTRVKQLRVGVPISFYDLKNDPSESDNLVSETTRKPEIERLGSILLEHMKRTNDPQTDAYTKAMKEAGFTLKSPK